MFKVLINLLLFSLICIIIVSCGRFNVNIGQDNIKSHSISKESEKSNSPSPEPLSPIPSPVKVNNTIGSFSTKLIDNSKNRVNNISIAVEEVDGCTLEPGELFSFNDIVGRRTSSKGYKKAKILVKGKVDWSEGGGICQLSSTIYNAAEKAGMTIIERHSHSSEVRYVPSGKDAAVNFGSLDFKFKNSKDYTVLIEVNVNNNMVNASIVKT